MTTYKIGYNLKKCHKDSPLKSQRPHTQTDHPAIRKYKILNLIINIIDS